MKIKSMFLLFCSAVSAKPNFLLVVSDDLAQHSMNRIHETNPEWQYFSDTSTVFTQCIVQMPVCGPSRASFLTGKMPDELKHYNFEKLLPQDGTTNIANYFKNKLNYKVAVIGKVFHNDETVNPQQIEFNMGWLSFNRQSIQSGNNECVPLLYCTKTAKKAKNLADTDVKNKAKIFIQQQEKNPNQPWILMIGFHRPHATFSNQEKYLSQVSGYIPDYSVPKTSKSGSFLASLAHMGDNQIGWAKVKFAKGIQPIIYNPDNRKNIEDLFQPKYNEVLKAITKQYDAAALSVLDNTIQVVKQLEYSGFKDNTHVIFFSDNGFSLGERSLFEKSHLFEEATNVPLIIHLAKQTKGFVNKNPVALLDIFPTLIELADGPAEQLTGISLVPALNNANYQANNMVISQAVRCQPFGEIQRDNCMNGGINRKPILYMGYLVVSNNFRYTEWREFTEVRTEFTKPTWDNMPARLIGKVGEKIWQIDTKKTKTNWNGPILESFLHKADENGNYGDNLIFDPKYNSVVEDLSSKLKLKARAW